MAKKLFFLPALALALCFSNAIHAEDEFVVELDKSNFDELVGKTELAIVEFFAPWCGHCKKLAPEYEKAAEILKEEGVNVVLFKVDADKKKNKKLAKKYEVQGFPTLKVIRNGKQVEDYNGPREADGIVQYVKKLAGPPSVEVTTADQAAALIKDNSVLVVGVFADLESAEAKSFLQAAGELRNDYSFAHTVDGSLFPEKDVPIVAPIVRVYKNFDEGFNDIKSFESAELKPFLEAKTIPSVVEMNQDPKNRGHLEKVFATSLPKVLLFLDYSDESLKKTLSEAYGKVAKEGNHKVAFIIGDDKQNNHAMEYFGAKSEDSPVLLIHDAATDKKYTKTNINAGEIGQFVADFEAGKLTPKIKSEPIPEKNDGPVTVVVTKNIDDVVFNSKKNVLVEFYAPWCGHCKKLAPIFDKVGEHFAGDDSVVIAKMDATANDVPKDKFNVEGFPTIYFVDASGKISLYEGGRTKKDFISYVTKHKVDVGGGNSSEAVAAPTEEAAVEAPVKDEL